MTNKNKHTSIANQGPGYSPDQYQDDEISLIDIWRILFRQKKLIISLTLVVSLGATIYAFVSPSVYKAEAFLLPPLAKDIVDLNISPHSISGNVYSLKQKDHFTSVQIFNQTVRNLKLHSLQRQFFAQHKNIPGSFSVRLSGKGDISGGVFVAMEGGGQEILVQEVNAYVTFVNAYTAKELVDLRVGKLAAEKADIQRQITALRSQADKERFDRIAVLEESLVIAQKLGIKEMVINPKDSPLYLRGSKALSSEIDVLKKRKDVDPFIPDLRELQLSLLELNQIKTDISLVRAVQIDQLAVLPHEPIKPKRRLIIVLGTILGLMAGVFIAFVANFIEVARRQDIVAE